MQLQQTESFEIKGPQLEVLGNIETALPAPAKKRPAAAAVLVVLALVSVFGIGGAKLKGVYNSTSKIYTSEVDKYGRGIQDDIASQLDAAANLIRTASGVLGGSDANVQNAQAVLDAWNADADNRNANYQYDMNKQLYSAVDMLYTAAADDADSKTKGQLTDLYDGFVSTQAILERECAAYNEKAADYSKNTAGFPGGLIAALWGVGDIPTFAP